MFIVFIVILALFIFSACYVYRNKVILFIRSKTMKKIIFLILLVVILLTPPHELILARAEMICRYFIKQARILTPVSGVRIFCDGLENKNAKTFRMFKNFDGEDTDKIIVYVPNESLLHGREIFMIDMKFKKVGEAYSSISDYQLVQNKYLFQCDAGENYIAFDDLCKGRENFKPGLKIGQGKIEFNIPNSRYLKYSKMLIFGIATHN